MRRRRGIPWRHNAMWKKRPYGQIEKCAEAMALRRAFPEVGDATTSDELAGRHDAFGGETIDAETGEIIGGAAAGVTPTGAVKPPKRKAAGPQDVTDVAAPAANQAAAPAETSAAAPVPAPAAAPAAAPAGSVDEDALASEGERAFIKKKAASLELDLAELCAHVGIKDFERLSRDGSIALRDELRAREG